MNTSNFDDGDYLASTRLVLIILPTILILRTIILPALHLLLIIQTTLSILMMISCQHWITSNYRGNTTVVCGNLVTHRVVQHLSPCTNGQIQTILDWEELSNTFVFEFDIFNESFREPVKYYCANLVHRGVGEGGALAIPLSLRILCAKGLRGGG